MVKIVFILIEDLFEDPELIYPYYRMKEEGYKVFLVGPEKGMVYTGKKGVKMTSDISAEEALGMKANALIIPGGYSPDLMRRHRSMVELVEQASRNCLVIGAICHGPWMLIEADIIRGIKATGFYSIAKDMINAGAEYIDNEVVVDKNIITSRKPDDLPEFCKSIIEMIKAYFKDN